MTPWTKEQIVRELRTNNRLVERAIIVLYNRQTTDEKTTTKTRYLNNRGFSSAHARIGSICAKYILSGHRLSGKWLDKARAIAIHYAGQLAEESKSKHARSN